MSVITKNMCQSKRAIIHSYEIPPIKFFYAFMWNACRTRPIITFLLNGRRLLDSHGSLLDSRSTKICRMLREQHTFAHKSREENLTKKQTTAFPDSSHNLHAEDYWPQQIIETKSTRETRDAKIVDILKILLLEIMNSPNPHQTDEPIFCVIN